MGAVMIIHLPGTEGSTRKVTERAFRIAWEPAGYRELDASAKKDDLIAAADTVGVSVDRTATREVIVEQLHAAGAPDETPEV